MMLHRYARTGVCLVLLLLVLSGCRKKEWDAYYGRPDNLAPPIYQTLQARGNFTHMLACIDKSGYKENLSNGGYWTLFAPNDAAFELFFKEHNISGDAGIDSVMAAKIVRYALVYNAYRKADLGNGQTAIGPDTSMAFKRKTAYYDWVQPENGKLIVASNLNGGFNPDDNNNKYIPYFLDNFLAFNGLSATDYNFFYPTSAYKGFNVANAAVINADIAAENGLIDEIDRVILPLPSLEDYLKDKPQYSEFRKLLSKVISYQSNADITIRNQALTGKSDSVFVKYYDAGGVLGLAFGLNNENFVLAGTDAQKDGWGLVIPTNAALIPYEQKILAHYKTFDAAPPEVLISLLNAHMWQTSIWPSKLAQTPNSEQELPTFALGDVVDKQVCSNGFFYGIKKVQDANVFRTIFGKPFLDPAYSLMTRALSTDIKFSILNPDGKYTMVMMSNKNLLAAGYDYDFDHSEWTYTAPGGTTGGGASAESRLYRILKTSVFVTQNGELDNLSGSGIVASWEDEYVKYKNNTLFAGGNEDEGSVVTIDSIVKTVNGNVIYVNGVLKFSEETMGHHLAILAADDPDNYSSFFEYLKNSNLWQSGTETVFGLTPGSPNTLFVPTNAAIITAVKSGLLPGDIVTGEPNFKPGDNDDKQTVVNFINYHILNKNTVVTDGKKSGAFVTMLKTIDGDLTFINIENQPGHIVLKDINGGSSNLINAHSNHLGDRSVIHSIDRVLNFNVH
ncbi:MAG TPA: fasciclin domain-containing protein [Arachidicoccus sp.]|nr:fasciclin domain-containing protein [Arachidicoccus sp.]